MFCTINFDIYFERFYTFIAMTHMTLLGGPEMEMSITLLITPLLTWAIQVLHG
jgi:hypothetical protein